MITRNIKNWLLSSNAIRDRVGNRIYHSRVNAGVNGELLIIRDVTNNPIYNLDAEVGLSDAVIQVDSYSNTPYAAWEISELVRNRLSGYRGALGTDDSDYVQSVRIIATGTGEEEPEDASDIWMHRYRQDFALYVRASVPTFT